MSTNLRVFLLSMFLMCSLLACTDYDPRLLSPSRLRLKTTTNVNSASFPFSTEYRYDANNRVISFTTSMSTRCVFTYDEQNRYERFDYFYRLADEANGETTRFVYNPINNDFTRSTNFIKNGNSAGGLPSVSYTLDENKRLTSTVTGGAAVRVSETYRYTGDNITSVEYTSDKSSRTTTYEYDDKLNPYRNLIAPDVGEIRRFSRNNVTKITNGTATSEYVYEYNEQRLPTKMSTKDGVERTRFTYESY